MEKARYIAVEGPIGVGKTSLAERLAAEFNGRAILEDADSNPFLKSFYSDKKKFAFQTQIFFLLGRHEQQKEIAQQELFQSTIITDYVFAKDRIFAYLNLDENELRLYEQIYKILAVNVVKPDLLVYLQASTEVLMDRLRKRNKEYETNIDEGYIETLVDSYNRYFFTYGETPLLVVNTTDIDFVEDRDDLSNLVRKIRSIKGGVHHYIPLGSRRL